MASPGRHVPSSPSQPTLYQSVPSLSAPQAARQRSHSTEGKQDMSVDQEALDLTLSRAALMFSQKRAILNRTPSNTAISSDADSGLHASASDTIMRAAEAEKLSGLQAYTTSLEKSLRNAQKIIKERDESSLVTSTLCPSNQSIQRIATLEIELADAKRELGLVQAWTQRPRKSSEVSPLPSPKDTPRSETNRGPDTPKLGESTPLIPRSDARTSIGASSAPAPKLTQGLSTTTVHGSRISPVRKEREKEKEKEEAKKDDKKENVSMADKVKRTFRLSQHVTQIDYPTFGASLEDLTVPPSEVPAFVSSLLSHLDSIGAPEALMSRRLDSPTVASLKEQCNKDKNYPEIFSKTEDANALADLLLLWLEELPEPLVKDFAFFSEAMRIEWEEYRLSRTRSLLFAQKSAHRATLQFIIEFLIKRSQHASETRLNMDSTASPNSEVDAYAKSFGGPCMIRKKGDSVADATSLFAFFITNFDSLFLTKEDAARYEWSDGAPQVQAANTTAILIHLLDDVYTSRDEEWTHVVLCTHRYFVPSLEFFVKLREIYTSRCMGDETPRSSNTRWKQRLQMSILNVVRVWVENYPYFLKDRVLLKEVKAWLSDVEKSGKFKDTLKLLDKLTNAASATPAAPPPREVVRQKDIPRLEAVNYNDLAEELTLIDHAALSRVDMTELLYKNLNKPSSCPTFSALVTASNKLSQWVAAEIVVRDTTEHRAKICEHFIKTAKGLVELNNFHTASAVLTGLGHPSVTRLRNTWLKISKKLLEKWNQLNALFDVSGNFRAYRSAERTADAPFVPLLLIISKDITAIEESQPTETDDHMVNIHKLRLLQRVVRRVQRSFRTRYTFESSPYIAAMIGEIRPPDDEVLNALSLKAEAPKVDIKK